MIRDSIAEVYLSSPNTANMLDTLQHITGELVVRIPRHKFAWVGLRFQHTLSVIDQFHAIVSVPLTRHNLPTYNYPLIR